MPTLRTSSVRPQLNVRPRKPLMPAVRLAKAILMRAPGRRMRLRKAWTRRRRLVLESRKRNKGGQVQARRR